MTLETIEILNKEDRMFKSWGSVELVDSQDEVIPIDEFKPIMPVMMKRGGPIMDMHSNRHVGKILSYEFVEKEVEGVRKPGLLLTGMVHKDYPVDDEVWEKIKAGEYKGMSFGGMAKLKQFSFKDKAAILKQLSGLEWSLVDQPANPEATITAVNMLAKSEKGYKKPVEKGPKCMEALQGRGFSEAEAHNICYADDIAAGNRDAMSDEEDTQKAQKYLNKNDVQDNSTHIQSNNKRGVNQMSDSTTEKQETPQGTESTQKGDVEEALAEIMSRLSALEERVSSEEKREDEETPAPPKEEEEEEETEKGETGGGENVGDETDVAQDEEAEPKTDNVSAIKSEVSDIKKSLETIQKGLVVKGGTRAGADTALDGEKGKSNEVMKGILGVSALDVAQGKVKVTPHQIAKARQEYHQQRIRGALGY